MAVFLKDEVVSYEEIHRFPNEPLLYGPNRELCWQPEYWLAEMSTALKLAFERAENQNWQILSIGIDTWGVDMAYFDAKGKLLQPPYCYRSERTAACIEELHAKVPLKELYASGGNAYFPFNSIYQLYCDIRKNPVVGKQIVSFFFMPDFLLHLLSGEQTKSTAEYCIASTSGLCDAQKRDWNWSLIDRIGLPKQIFPAIVEAPCLAGALAESFGPRVPLLKVASHDTAAAAASIELDEDSCFLICGTWFILGIVAPQPYLDSAAFEENIVNEGAALGSHRVQKLFCGFWLLQQLHKEWGLDYSELSALAEQSTLSVIPEFDVADESLVLPSSMEQALTKLLGNPYSCSDLLKIVYRNMALACSRHLASLEGICDKKITLIHAVGGGCRDVYFIRELETICARRVELGPVEASVLGNAALQFLYHQKIRDLAEYQNMLK